MPNITHDEKTDALLSFARLDQALSPLRESIVAHPVYERIRELPALRAFMASHVFAVWDFMSLLKTLQQRLTCTLVPWLPPANTTAARLINEIVLGEETDELSPGQYTSHYELYLTAMREVGADATPVLGFTRHLARGASPEVALTEIPVLPSTRNFVKHTLDLCRTGSTVEVAAAFLLGREQLVPRMFTSILGQLEGSGSPCPAFRLYLDRHIHLDGEEHGPKAQQLLCALCGTDESHWLAAQAAAEISLGARHTLWDGVLESLESEGGVSKAASQR